MRIADLLRRWNAFFFAPQSPAPVALYRILFGALNVANLILLRRDWLTWFGPDGAVPTDTVGLAARAVFARTAPTAGLFSLLPHTNGSALAVFWVFFVAAACLTVGFCTRLSSILVFAGLMSIQARNPFIINGGDQLLRITGAFLIFAPAGAAMSVDRLIRIRLGREGLAVAPYAPWAQRLIQLQVAIMYLTTAWWKLLGTTWVNGTAIYYALQLTEVRRFPLPDIQSALLLHVATWMTLAVEVAAGVAIWCRKTRYVVLAMLVALHLGIEYTINIPLFEWISIAVLVTFVYPEDLTRAWEWVRSRLVPRVAPPVVGIAGDIR